MVRWVLLLCAVAAAAAPGGRERALREAVWGGRWLEGVRLYRELEAAGLGPSPQASYLAGYAQWKLRRPEDARAPLQRAADAGFRAGGNRLQPRELLARIDSYMELRPARIEVPGLDSSEIEVYAGERTPRTAPVIDALPRIASIGRRIFGGPPPVRFFLFAGLPRFSSFFEVFDESASAGVRTAHSTGVANMVLYCEEKARRGTEAETVSLALHETMHAWMATYLRNKYDRPIPLPAWVDEGLATYVARLWSPEVAALPARRLAECRRRGAGASTLGALRDPGSFQAPARAACNYWLSEQLIERLIGPPDAGVGKIRPFLDAYAKTGDEFSAWREVSGRDAEAEFSALAGGG